MSRLPSPDRIKDPEIREFLRQLVQAVERQNAKFTEKPFTNTHISVSNATKQYSLDLTSVGLVDVGRVLGTFILQFQEAGIAP